MYELSFDHMERAVGTEAGMFRPHESFATFPPVLFTGPARASRRTSLLDQDVLLVRCLDPRQLTVRFQPIIDIGEGGSRLHALECLIRGPEGTAMESPDALFGLARERGQEALLDQACIIAALEGAASLPAELDLSLNVHASTLSIDPEFCNFLGDAAMARSLALSRLIVEIVEHAPPWDVPTFREALDTLRHIGVRIALDDVGQGHSNYGMILESRPDYFKIDRFLVKGLHADFYRQAVLESICQLAHRVGARVVAEGIDNEADLAATRALKVDYVQGFLFAEPLPASEYTRPGAPSWPLAPH
jgi:EAL domain-containing protein (putative c-di-GMP-specific phosphodiesterase class I)